MKTLVIVDIQKDFYDPKGSLYVSGAETFPSKIADLVPGYDNVYFTLDWHPLNHCSFKQNGGIWPVHCLKYSWGASLPDEVLASIDSFRQHVSYYHKGDRSYEEEYEAYRKITDNQLRLLRNSEENVVACEVTILKIPVCTAVALRTIDCCSIEVVALFVTPVVV